MNTKKTILGVCGGLLLTSGGACLTAAFTHQPTGEAHPSFQFEVPPYVMSCGYKVYKDPEVMDGRFWVAKSTLKNEGEHSLYDLEIACRIPGLFTEWEHPRKFPEMLGGQTLTNCYYPNFPDSMVNKTTRDRELIDVRIRYLTQRIQQRMGGSNAISGRREDVQKFIEAVYDTLADCGVRYGGTSGLPEEVGGINTVVQEVRLPREVIAGTAGLCIELWNLFASICSSEGLRSQIFLTNNHAWPAVQLSDGSYLAVEATMLGTGTFEQAFEVGFMSTMAHLNGGYFETKTQDGQTVSKSLVPMQIMDVKTVHDLGIRPVELADSPELRERIDTLFEQIAAAERAVPQPDPAPQQTSP